MFTLFWNKSRSVLTGQQTEKLPVEDPRFSIFLEQFNRSQFRQPKIKTTKNVCTGLGDDWQPSFYSEERRGCLEFR